MAWCHPLCNQFIMPTVDLGADVEFKLKTGETIRGMLLDYDANSETVWVYNSDNKTEPKKVIFKRSEIV